MQSSNTSDWTNYDTDGYSIISSSVSIVLETASSYYREYIKELRRLEYAIRLLLLVVCQQILLIFLFSRYSNSYPDQRSIDPPKIRSPGLLRLIVGRKHGQY